MSVLAQISIVFLIGITVLILIYANRGLRMAAEENVAAEENRVREENRSGKEYSFGKENRSAENNMVWGDDRKDDFMIPENGMSMNARDDKSMEFTEKKTPIMNFSDRRREIPVYTLRILDQDQNEAGQVEVDHYPFSIGRDSKNDLELNDICVARFHCQIVLENGWPVLKDNGSANKIFVEGKSADQWVLRDGGHFYLGNMKIYVKEGQGRSVPTKLAYKPERMSVG